MGEQILNRCKAKEVENIATHILFEIKNKDWSMDSFMTLLSQRIEAETDVLTKALNQTLGGEFTEELAAKDAVFDKDFICFEQFVEANLYMRDDAISAKAKILWQILTANDLKLYIQSYESQITSFNHLLAELEREEIKPLMNDLLGVSNCLALLKDSAKDLANTYDRMKSKGDEDIELIAPSVQQKLIREIINNDLLPYLCVMANVNKQVYGDIKQKVEMCIEDLNIRIRARNACAKIA